MDRCDADVIMNGLYNIMMGILLVVGGASGKLPYMSPANSLGILIAGVLLIGDGVWRAIRRKKAD